MSESRRLVVGAIIVDSLEHPRRLLAARRTGPPELAGLWEFPGGKVEPGETARAALARELDEELSIAVQIGAEHTRDGGPWPIIPGFELRLFFAQITRGVPVLGPAHDAVRWLDLDGLDAVPWLPSDAEALAAL